MKKYLFILLAGLLCVVGNEEAEAKAVKIGRGVSGFSPLGRIIDTDKGDGDTRGLCPKNCASCDASGKCTQCNSGFYISNNACTACSTINVGNGTCTSCSSSICDGANCSGSHPYFDANEHVCKNASLSGNNMTCISGYRKQETNNGYCCVPMCQGVTCVSGFSATVNNGKCCCQ